MLDEVGAGVVGLGAAGERALELARGPRYLHSICNAICKFYIVKTKLIDNTSDILSYRLNLAPFSLI